VLLGCGNDAPSGANAVVDDVSSDGSSSVDGDQDVLDVADVPDVPPPDVSPDDAGDASVTDSTPEDAADDMADEPAIDAQMDAAHAPDGLSVPDSIGATCFAEIWDEGEGGPDYDQFDPEVGEHCLGTNFQDIEGVEQLVFLGDSVTQGTPNDTHLLCFDNEHFYRNLLADWASARFGLDTGDLIAYGQWRSYSCTYNGEPGRQTSGDLHNCSKWGARNDDFLGEANCNRFQGEDLARCCEVCCAGGECAENGGSCVRAANPVGDDDFCGRATDKQILKCLPEGGSPRTTLFVFTMGGNDIASITKDGAEFDPETPEGAEEINNGYPTIWVQARRTMAYLEEAVRFLKDPERFPAGSYVIFANPFEFTDGTGMTSACSPESINIPGIGEFDVSDLGLNLAELAGFGEWADPDAQADIVIWMLEEYMRIARDHRADLVWMLEHFCGHGFVATGPDADTENRCYREDDPSRWFDITCTHPNDVGHEMIYRMFRAVIEE
jgi:lysophospholipase L1-like esterase